jgi:hypothetical protein
MMQPRDSWSEYLHVYSDSSSVSLSARMGIGILLVLAVEGPATAARLMVEGPLRGGAVAAWTLHATFAAAAMWWCARRMGVPSSTRWRLPLLALLPYAGAIFFSLYCTRQEGVYRPQYPAIDWAMPDLTGPPGGWQRQAPTLRTDGHRLYHYTDADRVQPGGLNVEMDAEGGLYAFELWHRSLPGSVEWLVRWRQGAPLQLSKVDDGEHQGGSYKMSPLLRRHTLDAKILAELRAYFHRQGEVVPLPQRTAIAQVLSEPFSRDGAEPPRRS